MKTFFFSVHEDMSRLMLDLRRDGSRVIACRGANDATGTQGWNISVVGA